MPTGAGEKPAPEAEKKTVEIVWDSEHSRFRTPDGKSYLSYAVRSSQGQAKGMIDLQHTYVPGSFRGQGMAARLCVAAFEHAKEQGFLVQPTCSYISDSFLPRNPEWNDLVVKYDGTKSGL